MYAYQLKALVEKDRVLRGIFLGVFSKNTLPPLVHGQEAAFIANTQHSSRVGRHWVSVYYNGREVYFIDPLGRPPQYYGKEFVQCLKGFRKVQKLKWAVQDEKKSNLCGFFNILFLYFLIRDYPLSYILLEILRQHPHENDAIVQRFICEKFGYKRFS